METQFSFHKYRQNICFLSLFLRIIMYLKISQGIISPILFGKNNFFPLVLLIILQKYFVIFFLRIFFQCGSFLKRFWKLNLLQHCVWFTFWFFGCESCGIWAPWPGIELTLRCVERQSLNHWTTREVPQINFKPSFYYFLVLSPNCLLPEAS